MIDEVTLPDKLWTIQEKFGHVDIERSQENKQGKSHRGDSLKNGIKTNKQ